MKRQKELPKEFKIHINGTFNTRLAISYSMTIEDKYDEYQRKFYENKDLEKDYSIVIERFRNDEQALNEWLSGEAPLSKKPLFEKLQGKTRRDSSLFTVDVHKSIQLNHDELEKIKGKFVSPPILKELKLQYHENGIGVFSSFLEIHLKQSLSCNYNLFHNLVGTLGEATIKSPHLLETIKKIDEQIQMIATKLPSYRKKDKVTDIINHYCPVIN